MLRKRARTRAARTTLMEHELTFVILLAIATTVALLARRVKTPYTVALVLAGLGLGATHAVEAPHLTKELLFTVFLPGLLFEAAYHLEFRRFWSNKVAILSLAIPGVVVAISITGVLLTPVVAGLHFVDGFTLVHGMVFGALIAATDPIAVVGLFRRLGAPKRLNVLIEGESLLNDGTAVVAFTLVAALASGETTTVSESTLQFFTVVGMGILVGSALGILLSKVTQTIDDPMIEITLTTIAAYGSFAVAEQFHYSGVIATVTAGLWCGNWGATSGMSAATRVAVESFWEYVSFALNSFVFLLIGFEVEVPRLVESAVPILAAYAVVTLARAVVVGGVSAALSRTTERIPWRWTAVLTWGGLRGSLSMVLVLSLSRDFPHRDLLVTMTSGVVIVSILLQGLSMAPLLRRTGLAGEHGDRLEHEVQRATLQSARAALHEVEVVTKEGGVGRVVLDDACARLQREIAETEQSFQELHAQMPNLVDEQRRTLARRLAIVRKDHVMREQRRGAISDDARKRVLVQIEEELAAAEHGRDEPEDPPA